MRIAKPERRGLAGDLIAAPEAADGAHGCLQGVHGAGVKAERAQWAIADAEAEDCAAARHLIDGRHRRGGDPRVASHRVGDSTPKAEAG